MIEPEQANSAEAVAVERATSAEVREIAAARFKVSIVAAARRAALARGAAQAGQVVEPPGAEAVAREAEAAEGADGKWLQVSVESSFG